MASHDHARSRRPHDDRAEPRPPAPDEHLVIVRFKGNRKSYYHNRRQVSLSLGQHCVVEADRGRDMGVITYIGPGHPRWWREAIHQGVVGVARESDVARLPDLRREELSAREIALEKIQDHGLDMHLVGVERRWDHNKLTFYFLAEQRVDFRALVRDLAGVFRTRIDLRQIGVRDEAKLKGGLGLCGREFCCTRFLPSFDSVTLKMAKDQQLPLNPAKLSGPCGRLRCCLAFEHQGYSEILLQMPKVNSEVRCDGRLGKVRKLDPIQETATVQFREGDAEIVDLPVSSLTFDRPDSPSSRPNDRRVHRRGGRRDKDS